MSEEQKQCAVGPNDLFDLDETISSIGYQESSMSMSQLSEGPSELRLPVPGADPDPWPCDDPDHLKTECNFAQTDPATGSVTLCCIVCKCNKVKGG